MRSFAAAGEANGDFQVFFTDGSALADIVDRLENNPVSPYSG